MFAVWYAIVTGVAQFRKKEWKYKVFYTEKEAREWYIEYRRMLQWDELDTIEPPVPFVDGKPQIPEYVDRGCKGQLCMF